MAKAEILAIGTELLLGQIINSNAQFLSQELADIGVDCLWHSTVGDNKARIKDSLRFALDRVDIVIVTGGLGPTADDLTIECIAEFFQKPLIFDESISRHIQSIFEKRGLKMPPTASPSMTMAKFIGGSERKLNSIQSRASFLV
jgi:nicotinamide-nucleotide amidase